YHKPMSKIVLITLSVVNIFLFLIFLVTQHFPSFAVLVNILNILLIIAWSIDIKHTHIFLKKHTLDIFLVIGLFLIAFTVYSYKVDSITPGVQGDEITVARASEHVLSLSDYVPFVEANYGHPTPLFYFTGSSIKLFGRTLFAIRLQSILFGALSVAAFYILLRLFFGKTLSTITAFMMLFSYPLVVISRLAYEISPSLFFQIMSLVFLYKSWTTKDIRYYAVLGLSLGAGLYTYVGFRTFLLLIIGLTIFSFYRHWKYNRNLVKRSIIIFLTTLFIITFPLLAYSLGHGEQIAARTQSLSPFNQGLPASEVVKELGGATFRLSNIFLSKANTDHNPNGDPDPRRNPSSISMFDIVTFLLFINGFIFLFTKDKKLFLIMAILSLSPLVNDIFSLERIPEGHYYGIGHPNTLRIAGIIPIIYFIVAFGLHRIKPFFDEQAKGFYATTLVLTASVMIFFNWFSYYGQPFNDFVYTYNGVKMLHVADAFNSASSETVYMSPSFINDDRVKYFTKRTVNIVSYTPKNIDQVLLDSKSKELIIIDADFDEKLGKALWERMKAQPELLNGRINLLTSPDNKIDAFIISQGQGI
ncbi:MAG TPA: glycosyltransferase family 39 protein, partial [Patescibacteria group bacterium]